MADGMQQDRAIYVISVAAELAGVHPQTLRIYERKGLLRPQRTAGNTRRYSERDIALLQRIQELTNEGVNLAGVMRILELEQELDVLRARHLDAVGELESAMDDLQQLVERHDSTALVPLREVRRVRRVLKADILEQAGRRTFIAPPISDG
jgi:MerR family transcriptional regulator/heat shock protein HspR